jgi:hypothetical protein
MRNERKGAFARSSQHYLPGRNEPLNDPIRFLGHVARLRANGWMSLAARCPHTGRWIEEFFRNGQDWQEVKDFLRGHAGKDQYFSVNVFSKPQRLRMFALQSRIAHADIDDADPCGYNPEPSLTWETSPGKFQGLWIFEEARSITDVEAISRHLVYQYGGDKGWSITKMLRLPGTLNRKPDYRSPRVTMIKSTYSPTPSWPQVEQHEPQSSRSLYIDPHRHDPDVVIARYSNSIRWRYLCLMRHKRLISRDRSRCIYMIVAALHGAGAGPDEIAAVLWRSVYFLDKYGEDQVALKEEISRILGKMGGAK